MATFMLTFACDNAAFDPDPSAEIARILRMTGDKIEHDGLRLSRNDTDSDPVRDVNGNPVGVWEYRT